MNKNLEEEYTEISSASLVKLKEASNLFKDIKEMYNRLDYYNQDSIKDQLQNSDLDFIVSFAKEILREEQEENWKSSRNC